MAQFKSGKVPILIATDVASRGLGASLHHATYSHPQSRASFVSLRSRIKRHFRTLSDSAIAPLASPTSVRCALSSSAA
jgi:superfamily II DNA/RNA helicase